jgi:hypothetical protein
MSIEVLRAFYIDFDPGGMSWAEATRLKLEKLENNLRRYDMADDQFMGKAEPGSERPGFLKPHKLALDWNLSDFWAGWLATSRLNLKMLALFAKTPPCLFDPGLEEDLDAIMRKPMAKRIQELKAFVRAHPVPNQADDSDVSF